MSYSVTLTCLPFLFEHGLTWGRYCINAILNMIWLVDWPKCSWDVFMKLTGPFVVNTELVWNMVNTEMSQTATNVPLVWATQLFACLFLLIHFRGLVFTPETDAVFVQGRSEGTSDWSTSYAISSSAPSGLWVQFWSWACVWSLFCFLLLSPHKLRGTWIVVTVSQ